MGCFPRPDGLHPRAPQLFQKALIQPGAGPRKASHRLKVLETDRLELRWLTVDDDDFILRLLNEPAWKLHIGDFGVRTLEDARRYLEKGPIAMYERRGFGLYLVELKATGEPIGICGLIKREALEDVDLGYALLEEFRGKGYAHESAASVLELGRRTFGLARIAAISSKDNQSSAKLLAKLGFRFERPARLKADADEVNLYAVGPASSSPTE
jgi:[ribosomal protein S5]-alanine N-acetyltransferase